MDLDDEGGYGPTSPSTPDAEDPKGWWIVVAPLSFAVVAFLAFLAFVVL